MTSWEDVERSALALPETSAQTSPDGQRSCHVRELVFVWERPLRTSTLAALGDAAPTGPLLGIRVADLEAKKAALADRPDTCLTTPHFDGYSVVLVRLDAIDLEDLDDLVIEAWLARAPRWLATACMATE